MPNVFDQSRDATPVNPHRRSELVGLMVETIIDYHVKHAPVAMSSEVACSIADDIASRLEAQGLRLDGSA